MDDETLLMTMLFDFFGDLLTGKQREYYDLYHNEDLSLSEIAEKAGITRQGVYDIVSRAEKALAMMERKTGVVQKWLNMRAELEKAEAKSKELLSLTDCGSGPAELASEITEIIGTLLAKGM